MNKELREVYVYLTGGGLAAIFISATLGILHQNHFVCKPMDKELFENFNEIVNSGDVRNARAFHWGLLDRIEHDKKLKEAGCALPKVKQALSIYSSSIQL